MEAIRQGRLEKPADELIGVECHELGFAVVAIILPAEGNRLRGNFGDPGICDGDAVSIAAEISEHLGWPAEGRFGIDDPLDLAQRAQLLGEGIRLSNVRQITEGVNLASLKCTTQCIKK